MPKNGCGTNTCNMWIMKEGPKVINFESPNVTVSECLYVQMSPRLFWQNKDFFFSDTKTLRTSETKLNLFRRVQYYQNALFVGILMIMNFRTFSPYEVKVSLVRPYINAIFGYKVKTGSGERDLYLPKTFLKLY